GDTVIRMRRRGVLRGRIVDRNGAAVAGAPLLIFAQQSGDSLNDARRERMLADEDGRFEVPRLLAGRVWVYVLKKPSDADENALRSESFRVKNGESRDVEIRMSRPERVHVTGEVQNASGKRIAHVPVFLPNADEQGWTIAKGTRYGFDAGGLDRGRYLVALVPAEDASESADGPAPVALLPDVVVSGLGAERFEFALPTSRLTGVITGIADHSSDSGPLKVLAVPTGLRGVAHEFTSAAKAAESFGVSVDEATGAFELAHLASGSHRVEVWCSSAETGEFQKLDSREVLISGSKHLGVWKLSLGSSTEPNRGE
ncbi:MAG: carboxypeptidase-like regulatory domain-containing protein, partial [Planctomycetota bacterium]